MSATILSCVLLLLATTVPSNYGQSQEPTRSPATSTSTSTPVPIITDDESGSNSQESNEDCGGGYKRYSGSCYKPHEEKATWNNANLVCNSEGGYLVEINDAAELEVVMKIRPETSVWTWVGLRKMPDGVWRSVLGHPFDEIYNLWAEDRYNTNDCGFLRLEGKLDDLKCDDNTEPFICEK